MSSEKVFSNRAKQQIDKALNVFENAVKSHPDIAKENTLENGASYEINMHPEWFATLSIAYLSDGSIRDATLTTELVDKDEAVLTFNIRESKIHEESGESTASSTLRKKIAGRIGKIDKRDAGVSVLDSWTWDLKMVRNALKRR